MSGEVYRDRPVRPIVITRGRTTPSTTIRPETLLIADSTQPLAVTATAEERRLVRMCRGLMSLAEAAAHLGLPLSVVAIVAADLIDARHLSALTPTPDPQIAVLEEVLHGLRSLRFDDE